ncbi:hypothetical protein AD946_04395 [Gluconobacter thailandicus]|nr:hypothetical protein AD946_04395 [Gluconobacter thailandicus]
MRVPVSVQGKVGKGEIVRPLKTESGRVARFLAAAIGLHLPELWTMVAGMEHQNEIEFVLQQWFQKELDAAWRMFRGIEDDEGRYLQREFAEMQIESLGEDWRSGRYGRVPDSLLEQIECPPSPESHAYTLLASQAHQALGQIQDAISRWANGQRDYRPDWRPTLDRGVFPPVPLSEAIKVAPLDKSEAADDSVVLKEAVSDYLRAVQRERNPTEKDLRQTKTHLLAFVQFIGADRRVASISRRDAGAYFEAVQKLPPNFQKIKELRLSVTGQWEWNYQGVRDYVGLPGIRWDKIPVGCRVWGLQVLPV